MDTAEQGCPQRKRLDIGRQEQNNRMASQTSTLIKIKAGRERLAQRDRKIRPPSMFRVILLNDDFTPVAFVVRLLQRVFGFSEPAAETITERVHIDGRGICGTYTRDIAITKAAQVESLARGHEHPLRCTIEPE